MRDAFAFAFIAVAMSLSPVSIPMASASTTNPLTYDDARHLLNRAGFGATDREIQRTVGMTREQAARNLLDNARTSPVTPPPAWTAEAGAVPPRIAKHYYHAARCRGIAFHHRPKHAEGAGARIAISQKCEMAVHAGVVGVHIKAEFIGEPGVLVQATNSFFERFGFVLPLQSRIGPCLISACGNDESSIDVGAQDLPCQFDGCGLLLAEAAVAGKQNESYPKR